MLYAMANLREENRRNRIESIKNKILRNKQQGEDTSFIALMNYCRTEFLVTKRTAKEYVEAVLCSGLYRRDGDSIFIPDPKPAKGLSQEDFSKNLDSFKSPGEKHEV